MSRDTAISAARLRTTVAFACVASGFLLESRFGWPSLACFAVCAAALAIVAGFRLHAARVALVLAAIAFSAGWYALRLNEPRADSLARLLPRTPARDEHPTLLTVRGVVLTAPRLIPRAQDGLARFIVTPDRTRFDLKVASVLMDDGEWRDASGRLWVRVDGEELPAVRAGDTVQLTGLFAAPDPPTNPGESDLRLVAAQSGFVGLVSLSGPDLIEPINGPRTMLASAESAWLRSRAWLQIRAREVVDRAAGVGDTTSQAFLRGLLLGDYDPAQRDVYNAFARQGLVHVLSISGFHLSAMALVALSLVRLSGDRGWIEPALVAALVLIYMAIVPPSSPVIRSGAMVLVLLLANAMGRRYDHVTLLGWIAIGLLLWRPRDLWSMGYQLSVGLTAALFWLTPVVKARLFGVPLRGTVRFRQHRMSDRLMEHLKEAVSANLLCWALATPLIAYRAGIVTPFAFVVSFLVTPVVIVVLWIGYVALLAGMFVPAAAGLASGLLSWLARCATRLVELADQVPLSAIYVPPVSLWWVLGATIGVVILLRFPWRRGPLPPGVLPALAALLLAWTGIELIVPRRLPPGTLLRIDTLDVGNGTCHLIRSGSDALLWDCGSLSGSGVQSQIVQSVRALGAHTTPRVVVTHPDIDHFAALLDITRPLGVREVITCRRFLDNAAGEPRGSAALVIRELSRRGVTVRTAAAGDELAIGARTVRVLSPPRDAAFEVDNDHSLVAAVIAAASDVLSRRESPGAGSGGEILALFTGDIQDAAITSLRERHPALAARAIELPHHGSARPGAIAWVESLAPGVVVQSSGPRRANDPRWQHLRAGREWLCTATDGACFVEFTETGVRAGSWAGRGAR